MELDRSCVQGKNAIVVGGASGNGAVRAGELLAAGIGKLVISGEDIEKLRPEGERLNGLYPGRVKTVHCRADVQENFVSMLIESLPFLDGRIDLLFNESGKGITDDTLSLDPAYYEGKTVVVTGAASGIGLALVEELLVCGAEKAVLADFNAENLKKHTARLSEKYPGRVKGMLCNVTVEQEVADMISEAAAFFGGRLDLLVNNAGAGLGGLFTEYSTPVPGGRVQTNEDWEKAFALNFYGALYGCRAAIPFMKKQGGGQIINVISGIAFYPMAYQSMYAATKAALNGLTLSLRTEYWDDNIRLSSATPGTTATGIWSNGGTSAPAGAQTPQQSARRILAGACRNRRVIFGDDGDAAGSRNCFNIDYEEIPDAYLLNLARNRRSGGSFIV